MIVFFGPAGAGKSVQGQLLAARMNWRWLSIGQLLRDTRDPEIHTALREGKLVEVAVSERVMGEAIDSAKDIKELIIDGFPREIHQAQWLIEHQGEYDRHVDIAIVLEVPREELLKRLAIRGRADDTPEAIDERLSIYRKEVYPILNYLSEQNVPVAHIDGNATVGHVHDRIVTELTDRGLTA
jgi:adenylate kinase